MIVATLCDTVAIAYLLVPIVFIVAIPFVDLGSTFFRVIAKLFVIVAVSIASFLNLMDVAYFDFSQRRTGSELFFLASQSKNSIVDLMLDYWWLIGMLSLIVWVTFKIFPWLFSQLECKKGKHALSNYGLMLLLWATQIIAMRGGFFRMPFLTHDVSKFVSAPLVGLATNTPHHVISTIQYGNVEEAMDLVSLEVQERLVNPYVQYGGLQKNKKNVVLIVLESFDKEYVGAYNQGRGYTPFLDSLLEIGVHYKHSYASGNRSIDFPPAILSSLPSIFHDSYINSRYNTNKLGSLGKILTNEGYYTSFYHGGTNGTMNFDSFIYASEFGQYYGMSQYPNKGDYDGSWGIFDEPYLQYYAKELSKMPQPFCSTVFTLSSHHPYSVPNKYQGKFPKGTLPIHESIGYADFALKQFFREIRNQAWYDNTIFVITADHASITDQEAYLSVYGEFSVPILFLNTNLRPQMVEDDVIQHKDLMASILYLLGYEKQFFSLGTSIFDEDARHFALFKNDGGYYLFQYPYLCHTSDFKQFKVLNQFLDVPVGDSIAKNQELLLKSYIQTFHNRLLTNKLY